MRKWLAVFAFALLFVQQAEASEAEISKTDVDFSSGIVTIAAEIKDYGKYDFVSLTVLKPDGTVEAVDSTNAADNVEFKFKIHETKDGHGGDYTAKITVSDGKSAKEEFYYAFESEREDAVESFFEENANIEELISDDSYLKVLGTFDELSKALERGGIAEQLQKMLNENTVEKTVESLQESIKKACIFEAVNQNKVSLLFSSDGRWKYEKIISLQNIDSDGKTVYAYYTGMTDAEKTETQRLLNGKSIKSVDDLYLEFSRAVLVSAVNKNTSGRGFLRELLAKNGKYVGLNLDAYNKISDALKDKADAYVLTNKASVTSLETLESVIASGAAQAELDESGKSYPSSSSSSSGGGGGGGVGLSANANAYSGMVNEQKARVSFTDIDSTHWAMSGIEYLVDKGIVNGYADNTFRPNAYITREEFIKLVMSAYSIDTDTENPFSDCAAGAWYLPYVCGAYKSGIITGDDKGCFGVGRNITRQDAAVILYRVSGVAGEEEMIFNDDADISDYAAKAVRILGSKGIITGKSGNNFMPKDLLTRAEASALLFRLLQL